MAKTVIANAFRKRLAEHIAGGRPIKPAAFMAFGSGGHDALSGESSTPNPDDPALKNELIRKPLARLETIENGFSAEGEGILEESELVDAELSEAALLDEDGNVIVFKNFKPKTKESDERYSIAIALRL